MTAQTVTRLEFENRRLQRKITGLEDEMVNLRARVKVAEGRVRALALDPVEELLRERYSRRSHGE